MSGSLRRSPSRIRRASRTQYERQALTPLHYQRQTIELEETQGMTQTEPRPPDPEPPTPPEPQEPEAPEEPEDDDQPEAPEAEDEDQPAKA